MGCVKSPPAADRMGLLSQSGSGVDVLNHLTLQLPQHGARRKEGNSRHPRACFSKEGDSVWRIMPEG